jgi:hypothetical protein
VHTGTLQSGELFVRPEKCHVLFYDIIANVIAAQRFVALALSALARKCHETYGYVTFYEICVGCFTAKSGH